jgi:sugar-specific transcriptional regulator TrmB
MASTDHLVRLGLNVNEAKALDALIALGPSGASDVHRQAGIPRNKAYEVLERLARRGMVEVQNGHPTLYRAAGAKDIIESLTENFGTEAKEALIALQRQEELSEEGSDETIEGAASAWIVRGENGIRRRLAELIDGAKGDIFSVGGYPPKYPLRVKTALKAMMAKGVNARVVCMIRPMEDVGEISADDSSVIEFRTVKASDTLRVKIQPHDEKLVAAFASMSGSGAMVVIDESVAFDIVDEGRGPRQATGILFKAPGIPRIQKATAERILALYTRKL